jgi:hypothetical protein
MMMMPVAVAMAMMLMADIHHDLSICRRKHRREEQSEHESQQSLLHTFEDAQKMPAGCRSNKITYTSARS